MLVFALAWALMGCAALQKKAPDAELTPKAKAMIEAGAFDEATLIRRFADGRLLVRLADGRVWFLDPKKTCSWCWIYVDRRVYVQLGEGTPIIRDGADVEDLPHPLPGRSLRFNQ